MQGPNPKNVRYLGVVAAFVALCFAPVVSGQDRDRVTRIEPGTNIAVRTNSTIDADRRTNQVYSGTVDQEVRGENGRLAIPRGSQVELIVRTEPNNDLVLDLESVTVNGERYALQTNTNEQESTRDNSLVGTIIGAINGGQARGRAIRIPANTVMNFRIDRPLEVGVADRGVDRDGKHYHDWYGNQ